jgi:hypothetical protein
MLKTSIKILVIISAVLGFSESLSAVRVKAEAVHSDGTVMRSLDEIFADWGTWQELEISLVNKMDLVRVALFKGQPAAEARPLVRLKNKIEPKSNDRLRMLVNNYGKDEVLEVEIYGTIVNFLK